MPVDLSGLTAAIADADTQATATTTLEDSVEVILNSQAAAMDAAVTKALTADNDATNTSIAAASAAIKAVNQKFIDSAAKLSAAVVANTPSA